MQTMIVEHVNVTKIGRIITVINTLVSATMFAMVALGTQLLTAYYVSIMLIRTPQALAFVMQTTLMDFVLISISPYVTHDVKHKTHILRLPHETERASCVLQ